LAQELICANHQVTGLDFRIPVRAKEINFQTQVNNVNKNFKLKTNSTIYKHDNVVIVALKSYQLNEVVLNTLLESAAELIFLQNGLFTKSRLQDRSLKVAIGTVTGVQATLKDGMLTASLQNSKIALELKDDCKKIKELIQKTRMQNSVFVGSLESQIIIYEKFMRWIIASSLNILYDLPLGNCLEKARSVDLILAISELAIYLENKFKINVDQSKILQDIYKLPKELRTSSYFDFKQGFQSELELELEYIIKYLTESNFKCIALNKWREAI